MDAATYHHPENFQEALERLLPDLSQRPEIEVDVLSHLVLGGGDVSLATFVRFSSDAIKAAREALSGGCIVVSDLPAITAALDQTRLTHLVTTEGALGGGLLAAVALNRLAASLIEKPDWSLLSYRLVGIEKTLPKARYQPEEFKRLSSSQRRTQRGCY